MINHKERQKAPDALLKASQACQSITQVSKTWPEMENEGVYAVQQLWAERRVQVSARIVGHKIGLTSHAVHMGSKMTEPDDDGHHGSPRDGHRLAVSSAFPFLT